MQSDKTFFKKPANQVMNLLTLLQLDSIVHRFFMRPDALDLTPFLSRKWLGSIQEDLMLELIRDEVSAATKTFGAHLFLQLAFSERIVYIFSQSDPEKREELYKAAKWMHSTGKTLSAGRLKSIALIFNINLDNAGAYHWVTVIINIEKESILYGDSINKEPPTSLITVLRCRISLYLNTTFSIEKLASLHQKDGYSCGILAAMVIGHYYLPKRYPFLDNLDLDEMHIEYLW